MRKHLTTVPVDTGTPVHIDTGEIPGTVATNLAQSLFEAIHRAYLNPAIQAEYQQWKAEQAARQA